MICAREKVLNLSTMNDNKKAATHLLCDLDKCMMDYSVAYTQCYNIYPKSTPEKKMLFLSLENATTPTNLYDVIIT